MEEPDLYNDYDVETVLRALKPPPTNDARRQRWWHTRTPADRLKRVKAVLRDAGFEIDSWALRPKR